VATLNPAYTKPVFELSTEKIDKCQSVPLAAAIFEGAWAFFQQPGAEEHFQEWKRRKAEAAKK